MNLLLDTHIWIWSLAAPDRLGSRVRRALEDGANTLWLSPISVWETLLLVERGRLDVPEPPAVWVESCLRVTPAREAPLTHDVAIESRRVALEHADPADRFLAATALVHSLTLVTADARLLACAEIDTLGNG